MFASKEEKYCRGQGGCGVKEQYVELLMRKNTFKKIIVAFLSQFLFLYSALSQSDVVSLIARNHPL